MKLVLELASPKLLLKKTSLQFVRDTIKNCVPTNEIEE